MPSLLDALSGGFSAPETKISTGDFAHKLGPYKDAVVNEYMKFHIDLNKAIAKIAKKDNLNSDQIQRIVEEVNNQVYLIKYNQMNNSPDRDVVFDLASLKQIKDELGEKNNVIGSKAEHQANLSDRNGLEKKASWDADNGDHLNMFNFVPYEFAPMSTDLERTKENIDLERTASALTSVDTEIQKCMDKVAENSHIIADALIQYSRHGVNTQEVFDQMCKMAQCNPKDQLLVKKTIEQKIGVMKEARELPQDYSLEIEFADITKKASEFSLKQYSFMKEAAFTTKSNQVLPVVVTNGVTIKDVSGLTEKMSNVSSNAQLAKIAMGKRSDFIKSAGLTEEQAEKLASAGKGFAAFGKALIGSTARNAKKNLDNASSVLSAKVNDDRIKGARSTLDNLAKSKKNLDIHPRMESANGMLSDAFDKYEGVARRTDEVLNENALKHPLNPSKYLSPTKIKADMERMNGKTELNQAQSMAKQQSRRIQNDLDSEISNAKKKLNGFEQELDIDGAKKAVEDAEKAYTKAVSSRKKARGAVLVGAGAGVGIAESKKRDQGTGTALYY
ncbi:MAG: hypothetical protein K0R00_131 [Herbinix sp.]|nr:hypothetical protein [Herbinix sp.]